MLCQQCHQNEATMHVHQHINGQTTEMHLCQDCAQKNGLGMMSHAFSGMSFLNGGLGSFFDQQAGAGTMTKLLEDLFSQSQSQERRNSVKETPCPACGTTWEAFQSNGLLGCATCYEHFADRMPALLRRLHGHTEHVGKTPAHAEVHLQEEAHLEALRRDLDEAIRAEDFERACTLRDAIRAAELEEAEGRPEEGGQADA